MKWQVCMLGNHDQAAMSDPNGFDPVALTVFWTRNSWRTGALLPGQRPLGLWANCLDVATRNQDVCPWLAA